jgi:hypothetical protein
MRSYAIDLKFGTRARHAARAVHWKALFVSRDGHMRHWVSIV